MSAEEKRNKDQNIWYIIGQKHMVRANNLTGI